MRYIGIDVSKATFVVAYSSDKGGEIRTFNNTTTGIKQFIGALPKDGSIHCVMEATGNYSAMLLYLLNVAGIAVSMENPLKIKNFARAMLSTVKTDKIDARLIALYGEKMNPQPFKIQGEAILRLRQKRTVIRQLTKQITAMSNLRGSLACLPVPDKGATHTVDETIEFLEKRRDRLQSELTDLVEVEFSRQLALLTTIKGIGITLATALIITTGGFTYFQNAKQVSRYLGICPTYEQSGTSVNIRGHINRNGDAYTRGLLWRVCRSFMSMPSSSMRANMVCSSTRMNSCRWASSVRACEPSATKNPMPRRIRISPSLPSLSYARITVLGLTCSVTASSRIEGMRSRSGQRPETMARQAWS